MASGDLRQFTPQPPDWKLDWYGLDAAYPWIQRMRDCAQSPIYHAEGDVWIHTRMVLEELAQLTAWRALDPAARGLVFAAAALHDAGKPATTRIEGGHINSRGHSQKGARMARRILWEMGVPPATRESIAALIRYHQLPYYLIDRHDGRRTAIEISQTARTDYLTMLAEADVRGRICRDLSPPARQCRAVRRVLPRARLLGRAAPVCQRAQPVSLLPHAGAQSRLRGF